MNVGYRVTLTQYERDELGTLLSGGRQAARKLKRAQILLAADAGSATRRSQERQGRRRPSIEPSDASWREPGAGVERGAPAGRTTKAPARRRHCWCAACSKPPEGRSRWTWAAGRRDGRSPCTIRSRETMRRRLDELSSSRGHEKMWCIPKVDAEFVARMEDVLALYAEPPDERGRSCASTRRRVQLIGEERVPVRASPGSGAASTTSTCATAPRTSSCLST